MILSIAVIVLVAGLTYIHYLQGAFTSVISLGCALAATLIAFGYYENLVNMMSQSGFADFAGGMSLIVLFAISYIVLRTLADMFVPGNILLQLYVEKTLSVVSGGLAAMLAVGTFAVGLQLMPFTATVAGYSPYEVRDRDVRVPASLIGRNRGSDSFVFEELATDKFDAPPSGLLLPADALALGVARMGSDGAFAGGQSFAAIHPDLVTEAFKNRLGSDHSGKSVVFNTSKQTNMTLDGLFTLTGSPAFLDTEVPDLRQPPQSMTYKLSSGDRLVVARVTFGDPAADKDSNVRVTLSAVRLVIDGQTFHPIGTMEGPSYVAINRIDDLIAVSNTSGRTADFVFALPKAIADSLAKPASDETTVRFLEAKLFGRVDLAEKKTDVYPANSKGGHILRKPSSPIGQAVRPAPKPQ